ncbi:alkaline shock response membrane anchor protein AmaP [Ammoniphilus sp. CFH 90114]|uniref:alkaline shock response membrane anchor protein AmaP n=1 Tax=Ammoniphilus sp. CFH 90114 TaxID=2493665 RepID=UPI0013E8F6FD|nr:alkaline shock response membrane anchor protein AmaP [Ammoniphilus sp. CFH 90114]
MNLFDRLILSLYSLALTILSVMVIAASLHLIPYELVQSNILAVYEADNMRYAYLGVAVIFFLISLKFLLQGFRRVKDRSHTEAIAQRTDWGHVSISVSTIESVALKAARRVRGVREVKSVIKSDETGTSILMKVSIDGDTPVPSIVEEVQKGVKEQVEAIIGIEIKQVDVKITEVAQQSSTTRLSRVE